MNDSIDHGATAEEFTTTLSRGREVRLVLPYGFLALFAAFGSLAACYSTVVISIISGQESTVGDGGLLIHFQAVTMWGLALLAVYALWHDRQSHGGNAALLLGGIATLVLVAVLYVRYDQRIEMLAYILLAISALLNQHHFLVYLNRTVHGQASRIRTLNEELLSQVHDQDAEISRLGRLREFLAPQIAELVIDEDSPDALKSRRKFISCLFCDIRNFTKFSETVEPEEAIAVLQEYHDRVGALVGKYRGTIGYRAGDGLMAFFNDPVPCDNAVLEATKLGLDIRNAFIEVSRPLTRLGHSIGIGVSISAGYATVGLIGVQGRSDYTAIGNVVNIAARLCDQASDGSVLMTKRAYLDVESLVVAESMGQVDLKGIAQPVDVMKVSGFRGGTEIEG